MPDQPEGIVDAPETPTVEPQEQVPPAPPVNDRGFPDATPVAEMTAEQQVAYWKHQARRHESTSKKNHEELETLRKQGMSDQERAVEEAREAGRNEANAAATVRVVAAELKAAGVPADDIADLDLSKFLTSEGEVDADKVSATGARFSQRARIPSGSIDAGPQGDTPPEPSLDQQIAAATQRGDTAAVIALNNQKLAAVAGII